MLSSFQCESSAGFAGLMLRDDRLGSHFDPRTVKLKFSLDGPNGVFTPLILDLPERRFTGSTCNRGGNSR